jgi:hypothetical protein
MKYILIFFIVTTVSSQLLSQYVQPVVLASGGGQQIVQGKMYVSYTIGEPAINTLTNTLILTQGFHQPYSLLPSAVQQEGIPGVQIRLLHNPVTEELSVELTTEHAKALAYSICDVAGRVLIAENKDIMEGVFHVPIGHLFSGMYFFVCTESSSGHMITLPFIKFN